MPGFDSFLLNYLGNAMLKFRYCLFFLLSLGSSSMALNIEQYDDQEALAEQAASIVVAEALASKQHSKTLVMIVPTGGTAIPFYRKIVEKWRAGEVDLSEVLFFNMDEYADLPSGDPNSYHTFMHEHFYKHVLDKPRGVSKDHIKIPNFNGTELQIRQAAAAYSEEILRHQASVNSRVILFGGIGRGPAHIAFNDFTEEFKQTAEQEREKLARQLGTRLVPLDEKTRNANKRFFDDKIELVPKHAITIGFKEILGSDRIIIMANDASKKDAIASLLLSKPSYKVPASLVKLVEKKVSIMVTKDCYGNESDLFDSSFQSYNAKLWSPFLKKNMDYSYENFFIKPEARVLIIQDTNSCPSEEILSNFIPATAKYLPLAQQDLLDQILKYDPQLIVLPQISEQFSYLSKLKKFLHEQYTSKAKKIDFIVYETEYGILSGTNFIVALNESELKRQKQALSNHSSQLKRTEFDQIAYESAREFYDVLTAQKYSLPIGTIGAEGYKYYQLKNGELTYKHQRPDPLNLPWNKNDEVIIVSPHPDDAEIGCGGLIQRLGQLDNPPQVLNATTGNRATIYLEDLKAHPSPDNELIKQAQAHLDEQGQLTNARLRGAVRQYESAKALEHLSAGVRLEALELEFYELKTNPSLEDRKKAFFALAKGLTNSVHKDGQLAILIPNPIDSHQTHRTVSRLFLDEAKKLSKKFPDIAIDLVYYKTPWSGRHNLFLYTEHSKASKAKALIGAERITQLGGSGKEFFAQENPTSGKKAIALMLSNRI